MMTNIRRHGPVKPTPANLNEELNLNPYKIVH